MNLRNLLLATILVFITNATISSQNYSRPLRIPPSLSANFGELRNNHFHSGLDYTTQYAVNKPVYSIADGFISRINVSPSGYGLALYIDHPETGQTSVYAHLNSFSKKTADYIKEKQYEAESYRLDIQLDPDEIPVKKGEQIALSGNTGSSGGPHLHFEIRDTKSEEPIDPLNYFSHQFKDNIKPDLRGIAIYPIDGAGRINNSGRPLRMTISTTKSGGYTALPQTVNAWGRIGIGVKAYDRMPGRNNIYGVKKINLYIDNQLHFQSEIDRFSFSETRMLNSFIDFEDWRINRSFYMKSFIEPGNTLKFYRAINNGYIDITEERAYEIRYELTDYFGNSTHYSFKITGLKQNIPEQAPCKHIMRRVLVNNWIDTQVSLNIPTGNLYTDICFRPSITPSNRYFSDIYQINDRPIPLHQSATLSINLDKKQEADSAQYGIIKIDRMGKETWMGGSYSDGKLTININELGDRYAIDVDKEAPVITAINPQNWGTQKKIQLNIKDTKSGIAEFRGEIDGKFVLFQHDSKSSVHTYYYDKERIESGKKLPFTFTATDRAGNRSIYQGEIQF